MIHVRVRIYSQAIPDKSEIELDDGSTVEILLQRIKEKVIRETPGQQSDKIFFLNNRKALIVLVNGLSIYSMSGWNTILQEEDEVSFLPMVAGG